MRRPDETRCPFCGGMNKCMAGSEESCWCREVEVPAELLALVPDDSKWTACICRACVQEYAEDPEGFAQKHR
ncbi:MAG: cysteine-rich CWC family protein [Terriglobia bacterium]